MHQSHTKPETVTGQEPPLSLRDADVAISEKKRLIADNTIKNYVILAMGTGLIPSSLVDIVAITALEVKMIGDLARIYDFPIPHRLVRYKILISLLGSLGPVYLSVKMHAALKSVPLIGHAVYVGMLSITGGVAMYAVGKTFQRHYESGGTFLSSENSVLKNFFQEKYQEGKKVVPGYARPAAV
ncbi:MAG: hypothetical protein VR64_06635 [Desulfatitalea sp. BRH_c12]|nr:MAG: hypothetical protein VR64_06635 [Desulfatitalea sp. BRH_c12]